MRAASRRRTVGLVAVAGAAALLMSACSSDTRHRIRHHVPRPQRPPAARPRAVRPRAVPPRPARRPRRVRRPPRAAARSPRTPPPAENTFVGSDDDYCDVLKAAWPDTSGKNVTVYTGISGVEAEDLKTSFKPFEECSGATVEVNSDKNFETQIVVQANSGSAPDIAFVPQPGLLQALVATNTVKAAPEQVAANVEKYWDPGWKSYGTVNDTFYAAPLGRQREVAGVVLAQGVHRGRLCDPADLGRDDRAVRHDRRRPARSRGVRASSRVRQRVGRPPTGWKKSSCARPALTSTTSGSPARSSSPTRRSSTRWQRWARSSRTMPTSTAGGVMSHRSPPPTSPSPAARSSPASAR